MKKAHDLKNLRVLLVDSDALLRWSMHYYFRNKTAAFVAVGSRKEAFSCLAEEAFDVVICEERPNGIEGRGFMEQVAETYPRIKRILTSAFPEDYAHGEAVPPWVHGILPKPFDARTVQDSLARVMREP